jgi:hypothetical protein
MEVTKRTYQKHKTDKKITVTHYLNTDIRESDVFGESIYPFYVQVTYNRKTTKFRSHIPSTSFSPLEGIAHFPELADINAEKYLMKHDIFVDNAIKKDEELIKWLINQKVNVYGQDFQIHNLPNLYHSKRYKLDFFINWCLNQEIKQTLIDVWISRLELSSEIDNKDLINFPITFKSSPLVNLEFKLKTEPELIILREKYPSQIWFFDIYTESIKETEITSRENFIYEKGNEIFYVEPFTLTPTIYDYKQQQFSEFFKGVFLNTQVVNDIINDIDKLVKKYSDKYYPMM